MHLRRPFSQGASASRALGARGREAALASMDAMITVCDISALARWGEVGLAQRLGEPCPEPPDKAWSLASAAALEEIDLRGARIEATEERPLHILVGGEARRVRTPVVRCHIWSTPLPPDALYQLTDEVLIASPAFCLQQMAARSSLARAAAVGAELCGRYARSPRARDGFHRRPPLMTPEELARRFADARGYGTRRAREAIAFVVAGSRSPMETVVLLLFTLPVGAGGCGLPAPRLNATIEIPASLQMALGKPYLVVDLSWEEFGVILEYESYLFHRTRRQIDSDSARNEGLRDLGWMVRSVTEGMLADPRMRRELVEKVSSRAGATLPAEEGYWLRQEALVQELLSL